MLISSRRKKPSFGAGKKSHVYSILIFSLCLRLLGKWGFAALPHAYRNLYGFPELPPQQKRLSA
jgi:hypothetical protein